MKHNEMQLSDQNYWKSKSLLRVRVGYFTCTEYYESPRFYKLGTKFGISISFRELDQLVKENQVERK